MRRQLEISRFAMKPGRAGIYVFVQHDNHCAPFSFLWVIHSIKVGQVAVLVQANIEWSARNSWLSNGNDIYRSGTQVVANRSGSSWRSGRMLGHKQLISRG